MRPTVGFRVLSGTAACRPEANVYEPANGSQIKVDITVAEIEFMGEIIGGTIIFASRVPNRYSPLPPLESDSIAVDLADQRVKRSPTVGLKTLVSSSARKAGGCHPLDAALARL